ncbi:MAG: phosphocholine cytidylyltransferase family protein [Planctomycetota bacterium]|nr:MAG: phosphocholine cytidylyltransferase family protein [Planctomycetota bacterium]
MGAHTDERPKGLVELRGKPLIQWQLDALRGAGVREIALVTGYRAETLRFDVPAFANARWAQTNMVASLACAAEWLRADDCIVSYADLVYPADAPRALLASHDDLAILCDVHWRALWERRFADPLADAETLRLDAQDRVLEIGRRPRDFQAIDAQYMGLFKLSARGAARLLARVERLEPARRDSIDCTSLLDLLAGEGEPIRAIRYAGWWCELDQASDLDVARAILDRELPA